MKKYFPLLLFFFLLLFPSHCLAGQLEWQLTWEEDNKIQEKLSIFGQDISVDEGEWNYSRTEEKTVLSREVENWQTYNNLSDRLPFIASEKDYILFKIISLKVDNKTALPTSVYAQVAKLYGAELKITVPGIISADSAKEVNELTATWKFAQMENIVDENLLLKATVFDGFCLGVFLFVFGFSIIALVFLVHIRRVNRLIEEEYSIDRVREEKNDPRD